MSRSPLVAWRKLFAIGGAPAASHLVLARAPSAESLLNALAGARVINADRLEALTKPLDIGGALSRVSKSAPEARGPDAPEARVRRSRAESAADIVHDVRKSHGPLSAPALTDRARHVDTGSDAVPTRARRDFPDNAAPSTLRRKFEPSVGVPSAVRSKPIARFASTPQRDVSVPFPSTETPGAVSATAYMLPPAAQSGANARVIVTSAVPDISRLLAATSTAATNSNSQPNATHPNHTPSPAAASRSQDVSNLLVDAVDRARAAISSSAEQTSRQIHAQPREATNTGSDSRRDMLPTPSTLESGGGFRGLAHRTLGNTRVARRAASQRIEPETRVSTDLAMDALDSRIADSLARVLEREARRHGIDLAEARS